MSFHDISDTPCHRSCCWTPYGCHALYACTHHKVQWDAARSQHMAAQFASDVADARLNRKGRPITEDTRCSILAAHAGAEGPHVVAREHGVSVSAVKDIWRRAVRGD